MKYRKYPLIVLEGLDLAGKTTCAHQLARDMRGVYYKFPPSPYKDVKYIVDNSSDLEYRFRFYMESNYYASGQVQQFLKNMPVVCDRYVHSTLVYHEAFGLDLSYMKLEETGIVLPDFCFFMEVSDEVYCQRAKMRSEEDKSVIDKMMDQDPDLRRRIRESYLRFPMTRIDASCLTVRQVCDEIISVINGGYAMLGNIC